MIGQLVTVCVRCPACGEIMLTSHHPNSAFYLAHCDNFHQKCRQLGVYLVIEKSSGMVVFETPHYSDRDGKILYVMLADEEGKQVWPEKKE